MRLSPLKKEKVTDKKTKEAVYNFTSQRSMFLRIYEDAPIVDGHKRCWLSGRTIDCFENSDKFWSLFAHVLPKGKYTKWKLNPKNIVLLHPEIHWLYDQGREEDRIKSGVDFTPLYELKTKYFIEYHNEK